MNTKTFFAMLALALASSTALATPPDKGAAADLYQLSVLMYFEDGFTSAISDGQVIPAGKQLMIRNTNYRITLPPGQRGLCDLDLLGGNVLFIPAPTHWVREPFLAVDRGYGNLQSEYYLGEGEFYIYCRRSALSGTGSAVVTVTGSLLDAQ